MLFNQLEASQIDDGKHSPSFIQSMGGNHAPRSVTAPTLERMGFSSVVQVLRYRADITPNETAFIHLVDGECNEQFISYEGLWERAQGLAHALQIFEPEGKRILMLFETGIDYVTALFGIFLADATAPLLSAGRLPRP